VKVTHRWRPEQNAAEVRIQQTQKDGAWHFPLEIEYRFPELSRAMSVTQDVTEKDVRFFVPLPARPSLVSVDPDNAVLMELSEDKGRDLWVNQLRHDGNPLARIRAAEHFGKSRRDADRRLLADALGHEKFWGVQAEIATALGASGGATSRAVLLQALSLEHPKARRAVVNALGKFKGDDIARDALEGIVRNGDASYYVEADAIRAWAGLRPEGALAKLQPLLERDSHNHVVRAAVLKGIGAQLDPAATDLLLGWTEPGKPRTCRDAALEGLATLATSGEWDDATTNRVVKAVSGCLDSSEHRSIKTRAAQTLRVLGEAAAPALAALEAIAEHDPNENVRKQAEETIDKIRSGAQPRLELQRLRDELRKLRDQNRKLEDRIERLDGKRASSDGE
jgi:aminopeptidase N